MTEHRQPDTKNNFKVFALLGIASAGLMGLFWSLDSFFIYIFAGACLAFFFLAFLNRPEEPVIRRFHSRQQSKNFKQPIPEPSQPQVPVKIKPQQILGCLVVLVIALIIIGALFGDAEEDDYHTYYQAAENYRYSGEVDSAKMYYRKAFSIEENAEAYLGYGNALLLDIQYDSAMVYYDKAIELDPDYVYAYYNKSVARYNQNRYDEAIQFSRQALQVDETYTDALTMIADSFYAKQRLDSALHYYERAYEDGARSAWISHVMAYLYDQKGKNQEAITFYKEALYYDGTKTEVYTRQAEMIGGSEGEKYRRLGQRVR